eukprot:SAG31_NODE_19370_length_604_cov_1.368317_1_plen_46_part_10
MLALLLLPMLQLAVGPSGCTFTPSCDYGKGSRDSAAAASKDACCTL